MVDHHQNLHCSNNTVYSMGTFLVNVQMPQLRGVKTFSANRKVGHGIETGSTPLDWRQRSYGALKTSNALEFYFKNKF